MESLKTHERIYITDAEREELHVSLRSAGEAIEEIVDATVEPIAKVTMLQHGVFIRARNRVIRGRDKAQIEARRARKKKERQQTDKSRRRNRSR
jgi:hypothetical protein